MFNNRYFGSRYFEADYFIDEPTAVAGTPALLSQVFTEIIVSGVNARWTQLYAEVIIGNANAFVTQVFLEVIAEAAPPLGAIMTQLYMEIVIAMVAGLEYTEEIHCTGFPTYATEDCPNNTSYIEEATPSPFSGTNEPSC